MTNFPFLLGAGFLEVKRRAWFPGVCPHDSYTLTGHIAGVQSMPTDDFIWTSHRNLKFAISKTEWKLHPPRGCASHFLEGHSVYPRGSIRSPSSLTPIFRCQVPAILLPKNVPDSFNSLQPPSCFLCSPTVLSCLTSLLVSSWRSLFPASRVIFLMSLCPLY